MTYTITINDNSPMAMSFIKYAKTLDFAKVTKIKETKKEAIATEELEEDEYGIPIKYRDKIMAMSKESNKNIARRWDEELAKIEEKQAI
jgi:hypothetical protein